MSIKTVSRPAFSIRVLLFLVGSILLKRSEALVYAQATIQVTTTQQGVTNGKCSLQEAIYSSQFGSNTAIASTDPDTYYTTGCVEGTGKGDTIELLPTGAVFTFDHFWDGDAYNYTGPTATPAIHSSITIEGNGATLQWVPNPIFPLGANSRLFAITPRPTAGTVTLRNVYVKGFHVKGGDGKDGGGGGLGAGGAIYVDTFDLIVENSTFDSNGAVGGNGGGGDTSGGGGGLAGNGGHGCSNSGGGGGGSRGNGGKGGAIEACGESGGGGGGGGTVLSGGDGTSTGSGGIGGSGGYLCGGGGGDAGNNGLEACYGGGGGGGGGVDFSDCGFLQSCFGDGAQGSYGGGGGGGVSDGGHGGFGGGGGAGFTSTLSLHGGDGGFGGGGGAAYPCGFLCTSHPGRGGFAGGDADHSYGGGGGALGGAIFNHNGTVKVRNCTFYNNYVTRGVAGGGLADNGADGGGAIFSLDNTLEITDSTFSNNQATGSGAAIVVYTDEGDTGGPGGGGAPVNFILFDTIIANNGANECYFTGSMNVVGAGNLIMNNGSGTGPFSPCPGVVTTIDPQLQPLQLNPPESAFAPPTMAILTTSPAADVADSATSLPYDARGVSRPQGKGYDIGAYEARPPNFFFSRIPGISVDVGGSGSTAVTLHSFEYFNSPISLTVPTPPTGIRVSFSVNPITPPYNGYTSSTMSVSLAPSVTAGSYAPTVTGTSSEPALKSAVPVTIVVTPTTAGITNVIADFVATGDINNPCVANALTKKLSTAQTYISAGDKQAAINILDALLNQLRAQAGKHITASTASVLIADTQALQASLGCRSTTGEQPRISISTNRPLAWSSRTDAELCSSETRENREADTNCDVE